MKLKMRIRNKTLGETVFNNRKLSSFAIASVILLTSLTTAIIFIPSTAKAGGEEPPEYVNLLPDGEGIWQDWLYEPLDPESHYDKVYDPVGEPDDDETYVYTDRNDVAENFDHETSELLTGATISNVRVIVRARVEKDEGAIYIGLKLFEGVADYGVLSIILDPEYGDYYEDWALKPVSGEPWTKEDIDGLESSIKSDGLGGTGQVIVTQVYINVSYTPSTTLAAVVDWGDENKINGVSYVLTANASTGSPTNYQWDLGNGTIIPGLSWVRVRYRLAGIYTINLTIYDEEANEAYAEEEVTIKQYISVVKNSNNNGVNYITWGANNSIMASKLADDLGLDAGDFIEMFDPASGLWDDICYDIEFGSEDFEISQWDHIMINLETSSQASYSFTPSGIETPHDVSMEFTESMGYNYITWSEDHVITPGNFLGALEAAKQIKIDEDITIYVYNPTTNNWASYNPNIHEVFNTLTSIQPYDVICFHAPDHGEISYIPSNW